ncbi:MAG: 4'-phosphopantetheinyl transferase superfamily protein [Fibrobacter sp.]|nr:4'-phosphopantetheinyl transferase superfamily protein [Fibrobacter sp.]
MGISVYIADVRPLLVPEVFERLLCRVPAYRQEKAKRFKFPGGRAQSLAVGLLLKKACSDFGIAGADEHVVLGENEKPDFANIPCDAGLAKNGIATKAYFNLSHSHERAMCVMAPYEVGCDVEQIKGDHSKLAERFFMPAENAWIQAAGARFDSDGAAQSKARDIAFYRLWTLKECYMKVTGRGLSLSPEKFSLEFKADGGILLHHDGPRPEYLFRELDLNDGYRYAYCLKGASADEPVNIVHVNLEQL